MRALRAVILVFVCLEAFSAQTPHDLNSRGVEFFRLGKYAESEKAYREAIAAHRAAPILDVNGYAASLNNLAGTLQTDGKVAEARRLLTEVISLDSQIKGEDEIVTHALNNLALLHEAEGEYPKAIALLKRALDRSPSPSSSKAGTLHNLGAAYMDMGQYKKAREILEASLQMHTQVGAVRETPPTLAFLGALAFRANDERQALILLERALTLRREIHGSVHPLVALSIHDLGEIYRMTNRLEESASMFDESLRLLEESAGTDHAYAAPVLYHYGELRQMQGRHEEALDLYQRTIRIMESTFGPNHARLAGVYKSAAISSAQLRRKDEAKSYRVRANTLEQSRVPYGRHTIDASAFTSPK
jgi:tetratricopeptide (TPR) repeat protein